VADRIISPTSWFASRHPPRHTARMPIPQTRYTKSGDVNIAYSTLGDGASDVVIVTAG
jgi:hypothetical protein